MAPFIEHFCGCSQVIDETLDVKEMIFNAERVGGLVDEPVRTWLPSPATGRLLKLRFGSCVVLNLRFGALTLLLGGHAAPTLLRSGVSSKYT